MNHEPTKTDLKSEDFNAVWQVIKHWDIGKHYLSEKNGVLISREGMRYSGATGTDVMTILNAVRLILRKENIKVKQQTIRDCLNIANWEIEALRTVHLPTGAGEIIRNRILYLLSETEKRQ